MLYNVVAPSKFKSRWDYDGHDGDDGNDNADKEEILPSTWEYSVLTTILDRSAGRNVVTPVKPWLTTSLSGCNYFLVTLPVRSVQASSVLLWGFLFVHLLSKVAWSDGLELQPFSEINILNYLL